MELDEMDFDEIVEAQGWNAQSIIFILREFISKAGLQDALNTFAAERAAEENGK
jgi:hypothetical protein